MSSIVPYQQVEVLTARLLERLGRVDDVVVVHLHEAVGAGLAAGRALERKEEEELHGTYKYKQGKQREHVYQTPEFI